MKLNDLIAIINEAYPDGLIQQYFEHPNGDNGDGLAAFIVHEVKETFAKAPDKTQLREAVRVIQNARDELSPIIEALWKRINTTRRIKPLVNTHEDKMEKWAKKYDDLNGRPEGPDDR